MPDPTPADAPGARTAAVYGSAQVRDAARDCHNDKAVIKGEVRVCDEARVKGNTIITDPVQVYEFAVLQGNDILPGKVQEGFRWRQR